MSLGQHRVIDAIDDGRVHVGARGRDDDFFRATGNMQCGFIAAGEDACAFTHQIYAQVTPGYIGWIALAEPLNFLAIDGDCVIANFYLLTKAAMHCVILEQMGTD